MFHQNLVVILFRIIRYLKKKQQINRYDPRHTWSITLYALSLCGAGSVHRKNRFKINRIRTLSCAGDNNIVCIGMYMIGQTRDTINFRKTRVT